MNHTITNTPDETKLTHTEIIRQQSESTGHQKTTTEEKKTLRKGEETLHKGRSQLFIVEITSGNGNPSRVCI